MPKYKTLFIDTVGEMARLYFSKGMGKHAGDFEKIRQVNDYAPATERLNIMFRSLQDLRDSGVEVVFSGNEQIEQIYAKGGAIAGKGQPTNEPITVKGLPDLPGKVAPEELLRKVDCILRMRILNGKLTWVAKPEPLGGSATDCSWVAGCRFNVGDNAWLPANYTEFIAKCKDIDNFAPPYIWLIYAPPKIGKTRLIATTFPKPMCMIDLDRGAKVLGSPEKIKSMGIDLTTLNSEECDDYDKFKAIIATCT